VTFCYFVSFIGRRRYTYLYNMKPILINDKSPNTTQRAVKLVLLLGGFGNGITDGEGVTDGITDGEGYTGVTDGLTDGEGYTGVTDGLTDGEGYTDGLGASLQHVEYPFGLFQFFSPQ
jgi:hypothetical protein